MLVHGRYGAASAALVLALLLAGSVAAPGLLHLPNSHATLAESALHGKLRASESPLVPSTVARLSGAGWPAGAGLSVSLCGDEGLGGSVDCAAAGSVTLASSPTGIVAGLMTVFLPPVPCPCVLLVVEPVTGAQFRFPVAVKGARVAPLVAPAVAAVRLRILAVSVQARTTLLSEMGGPAPRLLVVTVHNASRFGVRVMTVARWGANRSSTAVIASPAPVTLADGATARVSANFSLSALSFGRYTVEVSIVATGTTVSATTTTAGTLPYGLIGVIAVVILAAIGGTWRRRRRRRHLGRRGLWMIVQERVQEAAAIPTTGLSNGVPPIEP